MTFQSSVAANMAGGVVGELAKGFNATWKARPGVIDSVGAAPPNEIGRVFTQVAGVDDHCVVGGVIGAGTPFFGILSNPKEYVLRGTSGGGPLAPSIALPQYSIGDFVYDTTGLFVPFQGAGNVGDVVDYDTTTGLIYPRGNGGFGNTGAGTVAITTNVATVAGVTGNIGLGIGSVIYTTNGPATVLSLGTGTGGNGTYNLSVVANQGATANTAFTTAAPAGRAQIPGAAVAFKNIPAAGLGILAMSNP